MEPPADYAARINRVLDHITANLEGDLSVRVLAHVARFSPYHFHRVFRAVVGETCHQYVRRLRLEKSAHRLVHNPRDSITYIALECGFSSPETFARAFKEAYGVSATEWRAGGHPGRRKNRKAESKEGQRHRNAGQADACEWRQDEVGRIHWRLVLNDVQLETNVHVENLDPLPVAYIRHIGPYAGDGKLFGELFQRLAQWAGARGLLARPESQFLALYEDDPNVTEEQKLRLSVCVTVPPETEVDGEVGRMNIPGGAYAVARFELDTEQYSEAWGAMYSHWLPQSGYESDSRPAFERFLNNPEEHPEHKHIVELHVPVKPR